MPKKKLNEILRTEIFYNIIFSLILISLLLYYNWVLALISIVLLIGLAFITFRSEINVRKKLSKYIETLSYRIKKVGTDVIQQYPVGIALYDDENKIEWHNSFFSQVTNEEDLIGKNIKEIFPKLILNDGLQRTTFKDNAKTYQVDIRTKERLLYISDITDYINLLDRYEKQRPVLGIIHLDNLDEIGQGIDELSRSLLLTDVTTIISDWASEREIYLRRFTSDKFFIVTNQDVLEQLELSRFDILDIVREMTTANKIPLTLSIGIGAGADSFIELGEVAQSSLDIALGRGGDQAAVKFGERLSFYGGKSNAVEKRTRVRARVISHALRDLIKESDLVLIMGHKTPDMDAIGSAIGVLKAVLVNEKQGYIVLEDSNPMISKLLDEISANKELANRFIHPEKAINMTTQKTLLVIVDTHRPSLTIEPKLVNIIDRVVVIDHHRRSEEIVEEPVLIYIEPYASSTSELVTELLQYQSDKLKMDKLEATALLAGIVVDTKSFAYRTGTRTFEAASFLRTSGADTVMVQKFLKEDLDQYILKAEIVKNTKIIYNNIAIAVANEKLNQILIARTADTLLNMSGILASFVISVRTDGLVGISARSFGQINVQIIMERLGGGGHLTNAAAQLEGISVEEAEIKLIEVLNDVRNEGGLSI